MIQNIKVDIVYYTTATDFEFEFNLGSCCHMRLLNDKAKDKKGYVNSLARAVSRSTIILCVGPLFGEDGLISVTAAAIGKGLKAVDNKAFGITDDGKIDIIDGALPLVTSEGYFGGCIIESGPQTIVVLTENRTIRKAIMKTLIHPYIEDMSLMQSAGKASFTRTDLVAETAKQTEEISDNEPLKEVAPSTEPDEEPLPDDTDPDEEKAEDDDGSEFIEDDETETEEEPQKEPPANAENEPGTEIDEEDDMEFDFSIDPVDPEENANESTASEVESDFLVEDNLSDKKSSKGLNLSIIVIAAVLLLIVLALCYILIFLPMKDGVSTTEFIKRLFDSASSTVSV